VRDIDEAPPGKRDPPCRRTDDWAQSQPPSPWRRRWVRDRATGPKEVRLAEGWVQTRAEGSHCWPLKLEMTQSRAPSPSRSPSTVPTSVPLVLNTVGAWSVSSPLPSKMAALKLSPFTAATSRLPSPLTSPTTSFHTAPPAVYTPVVYAGGMTDAARDQRRRASVLAREGTGWDVGHAVRFLLSDHARYITGQTLVVDGGATLVGPARDSDSQH